MFVQRPTSGPRVVSFHDYHSTCRTIGASLEPAEEKTCPPEIGLQTHAVRAGGLNRLRDYTGHAASLNIVDDKCHARL